VAVRRTDTLRPPNAERLRRPYLAPDVRLHPPAAPGEPWIVQRGPHQYVRAGADMAALLRCLNGMRDHTALVEELGPPWTEPAVGQALASLQRMQMLDDGTRPHRHRLARTARFAVVPPLTLQVTLLDPDRLLQRLRPVIDLLARRAALVCAALLVLGGIVSLVAQAPALAVALGRPLPLAVLFAVAFASTATTALHELGHGAVLTYYGGRPSRVGVMLFYLTPAFFCDVSDGWRLPRKDQRVRVAMAGIATQLVVASAVAVGSAVAAVAGADPDVRDGMLVFALSTSVTGLLNLLPFVKLDGYIALMSHLDVPHLRDRAMTDGRRLIAKALFGGRYQRALPKPSWAPAFGVACLLFPLYLIGLATVLWLDLLHGLGYVGAVLVLAGVTYFGYRVVMGGWALVREARAAGASPVRTAVVGTLAVTVCGVALAFAPVPYAIPGGFVSERAGTRLVLPDSADVAAVEPGASVTLYRRGLVTRHPIATAEVGGNGGATDGTAPLSAFLPVREGDSIPVPAVEVPLLAAAAPPERAGYAVVDAGTRPLGHWLYLTFVAPALR
jgi:putative peptide zinc metalloprotease protein